jgi:CubicO group peptidase (beta-lactamase class C family)
MTRLLTFLPFVLAAITSAPATAKVPPKQAAPQEATPIQSPSLTAAAAPTPALTRADVEAWLDGYFPYALARGDIAGAVVVVVKDGQVLVQKGFGYADVAKRAPVDPERTLFRAGSVGKLFTWTAVMQLVEQGKLDLDRDINGYLDFEIPPREGKPITLRNLMTHTPGFEEVLKNLVTNDSTRLLAIGPYLKAWTPNRVFPPGEVPAYSNYGVTLAGYIVERVSGESYDDYIERHIFTPLGMTASSFRQPLPQRFRADMSNGYQVGSGKPQPFELFAVSPAGAGAMTGADMGRFMLAHLQHGALGAERILKPETVQLMHSTALPLVPPLHSMLLGFMQHDMNGRRITGHDGDTQFFHSALRLFMDDGVGVYLSVNSTGKESAAGPIRAALMENFADRYFPAQLEDKPLDAKTAAEHASVMKGAYEPSRAAKSSFLSFFFMPGQVKVAPNADSTLGVSGMQGLDGQPKRWREIAPYVWREVGGEARLAAKVENGRVVMFSVDEVSPFMVFQPAPWWRSSVWLVPALIAGLTALALTLIAWPTAAAVRRRYRAPFPLDGSAARAHRLLRLAILATVVLLIAWVAVVAPLVSNLSNSASRLDPVIQILHILSAIVFVGAAVIALWNARITWAGPRRWYAKLWSAVLAVACLSVAWVAVVFKLIGMGANY